MRNATPRCYSIWRAVPAAASTISGGIAAATGLRFPRVLGGSEPVYALVVSGNYFRLLGVQAALGRVFLPEEDPLAAQPVAMLSYNFWERRFSQDPGLLGRKLTLNGVEVTIVGITPRDFGGTSLTVPDLLFAPAACSARVACCSAASVRSTRSM